MSLSWPDEIHVRIRSNGNEVSGIVVFVLLLAQRKNHVPLAPRISNEHGQVVIRRVELEEAIASATKSAPMDYDGRLEQFYGLQIAIEDEATLNERIRRLKEFYPERADSLERTVRRSANSLYKGRRKQILLPSCLDHIEIVLEKDGST